MKIVIEGTKEEIEAILVKIAQPAPPVIVQSVPTIPWWERVEVTC